MRNFLGGAAVALALLLLVFIVKPSIMSGDKKTDAQSSVVEESVRKNVQPANGIAQAAATAGVSTCMERMNQVTSFITDKSKNEALIFVAPNQPDQRMTSIALEVQTTAALSFFDTHFSPNKDNSCGGSYDAVTYWPAACETVAVQSFAAFKPTKKLGSSIQALDGGQSVRVFLMPAGQGCISIKKEILF